jgi:hypothetical protein
LPPETGGDDRVFIWISSSIPRKHAEVWLRYWQPRIGSTMRMVSKGKNGEWPAVDFMRTAIDPNAPHVPLNEPWLALEEKREFYWPTSASNNAAKSQPVATVPDTDAAPADPTPAKPVARRQPKVTTGVQRRTPATAEPAAPAPVARRPVPAEPHRKRRQEAAIHARVAAAAPSTKAKATGSVKPPTKSALLIEACKSAKNGLTMKEMAAVTGWGVGISFLTRLATSANLQIVDHSNGRFSLR